MIESTDTSFCLISTNKKEIQTYIKKFLDDNKIFQVDVFEVGTENSVGIGDTRTITTFVQQKPFASSKKAVIIWADLITYEAQNALLKTLEEPPSQTIIFVCVQKSDVLLPTILSRCTTIFFRQSDQKQISLPVAENYMKYWETALSATTGMRLKFASDVTRDKDATLEWIREQIHFFYQSFHEKYVEDKPFQLSVNMVLVLKSLHRAHKLISQNISTKLTIDHFFLQLPYRDKVT